MPRSIWNGAVAFGAVTVPVKVYAAVEDHAVRFREVHVPDAAGIAHRLVDPTTGEEVPREEVIKGYEVAPGEWVEITDAEARAAEQPRRRALELEDFVPADQVDPVFYDRPYDLGPQAGAERGYALLAAALERAGRVGIGRVVLRSREQVVALRAAHGLLRMHTLHAPDEVLSGAELEVPEPGRAPTEREVAMAQALVGTLEADFDPARYRDTYRERVARLVEAKAAGEPVEAEEPPAPEPSGDLLAALQASVDAVRAGRG